MSNPFGTLMQQGYIVHDVEKAALEWAERVSVGPFYILDRIVMDQYYYRGVRTEVALRLAFAYWGEVQIELIQPLTDATSLYTDALQTGAGRLNHCATVVQDLDSLLDSRGVRDRVIQSGTMPTGVRFVYLENFLPGDYHLELIEATESAQAGFAAMRMLSAQWDGERPLRAITELGADMAALKR